MIYESTFGISTSNQIEIVIQADKHASADAGRLILQYSVRPEKPFHLTILQTSSAVYREALPVLYSRCVFPYGRLAYYWNVL